MILFRLSDLKGVYCEIEGGSKVQDLYMYSTNNMGWMPIDSVSFGFADVTESATGKTPPGGAQPGGTGGGSTMSRTPTANRTGANTADKKDDSSKISISRLVDRASPELLQFAMKDRKLTKADAKSLLKADIHFLHSVHTYTSQSQAEFDMYVYPYMQITLDNVLVKGWNISASGDDRPTENIELWFDKLALAYHRTSDGKIWSAAVRKGWNQATGDPWLPGEGEARFFVEPPLVSG